MKHTKLIILFFALLTFTWVLEACNNNNRSTDDSVEAAKEMNENKDSAQQLAVSEDDSKFAVNAANAGMAEVEAGKLAEQKAQSQAVKDLARMIMDDHTKANDELKTLAASKNITLPTVVGEDKQQKLTNLAQKSARNFDKDFLEMAIDEHKNAIDMFEKQSNNGTDADLKAFAYRILPTLRAHLDSARAIKDRMR